jgi:hypothetical protein
MREATAGAEGELRRDLAPRDLTRKVHPHLVGRHHSRAKHEAGSKGTLAN